MLKEAFGRGQRDAFEKTGVSMEWILKMLQFGQDSRLRKMPEHSQRFFKNTIGPDMAKVFSNLSETSGARFKQRFNSEALRQESYLSQPPDLRESLRGLASLLQTKLPKK